MAFRPAMGRWSTCALYLAALGAAAGAGGACNYAEYTPEPTNPVYSIRELGLLPGGTQSQANAGSSVALVGWATHADSAHHAVTFSGGQAHPLQEPPGATSSEATGVNASGVIVGFAVVGDTSALAWQSATAAPVALPGLSGAYTFAQGVNDAGIVLGRSDSGSSKVMVTWTPNGGGGYTVAGIEALVVTDTGPDSLPDTTHVSVGNGYEPIGINNLNQLAGNLPVDTETSGFFWSKQVLDTAEAPDGGETDANGLNNLGMMVGSYDTQSGTRAWLYTNALGAFEVAPPPAGFTGVQLNSVNDSGRVGGSNFVTAAGVTTQSVAITGTALDSGKTLLTLPTLGGSFSQPSDNAITTCGVILGWASKGPADTPRYAVAWVPQGCTIP